MNTGRERTDRSIPLLDPPVLHADDRGFLLGDGLFETVRVYRGVPFRLRAHLDRLEVSAATVGIPVPTDLEERIARLLARHGEAVPPEEGDRALRITLSRGRGGGLAGPEDEDEPLAALRLSPLPPEAEGPSEPLRAVLEGRLHEGSLTAALKGVGVLERIVALRRARARGADEALLRNTWDEIVEGAASNVVAITHEGVLVSPGPAQGALPGVTRSVILAEAAREGMEVEERGLAPGELGRLADFFLTSSLREMAPVVEVEGTPVGSGEPGPHFRLLAEAFRRVVAREVAAGRR